MTTPWMKKVLLVPTCTSNWPVVVRPFMSVIGRFLLIATESGALATRAIAVKSPAML